MTKAAFFEKSKQRELSKPVGDKGALIENPEAATVIESLNKQPFGEEEEKEHDKQESEKSLTFSRLVDFGEENRFKELLNRKELYR